VRRVLKSMLGAVAVFAVVVAMLALVSKLATEEGSSHVAQEGQRAIVAEATLSSLSALRNAATQANLLENGRAQGWVDDDAVASAIATVGRVTTEYTRRTAQLVAQLPPDESAPITATSAALLGDVHAFIDVFANPPVDGELRMAEVPTSSYEDAVVALVEARDARVLGVLVEADYAGQVADAVRFIVVFVIPFTVILVVRSVMRRRRERDALAAEVAYQDTIISSKDEFVANLSHELKTPLTGVYGFALALDEGGLDDPETARELTGMIVSEASELSRMVDDLITAGQIETGNLAITTEDIPIDGEIRVVIEPFQRIGVDITYDGSEDTVEVDRRRFRQILTNLVSNAVRHGGDRIEIFSEYGTGHVSIFVMDDGDGIEADGVETLFERYQHQGTGPLLQGSVGMGLAIAHSLAVAMGGSLNYTRSSGYTYFVLRLPSHKVARLNQRVDHMSLGDETAAKASNEVAKLFAR